MKTMIKTRDLTKYYGKSRGVIDVNLSVAEGDVYGFIGPNGAGKSTLIRTLLGLIYPTKGEGRVLEYDCVREKNKVLQHIGYMPSEAMFYSGMRVRDIIQLSARLHNKDCTKEAQKLCERFELDVKKKVEELSLGNRKKVSIVCAMQHRPNLYVLDEPTSGLDPLMQREFFDLLHERNKEGSTIFLSSHVLSEIAKHCNRAAIIKEGKLVAEDTIDELTKSAAKKVVLRGITQLPDMPGITKKSIEDTGITFFYQGKMLELIGVLQGLPITDMSITEPDLEEIVMHFYGGEKL